MTPQHQTALETLAGSVLTPDEVTAISPLVDARNDIGVAEILSVGRVRIESPHMVSERALATLDIQPRALAALVQALKDAQTQAPVWLSPVLTAAGVPSEDHAGIAYKFSIAYHWLTLEAGLDVGATGLRSLLDMIAIGVPASAPACVAVKALAVRPDPITVSAVSEALNNG
jgi:hypothetical protein